MIGGVQGKVTTPIRLHDLRRSGETCLSHVGGRDAGVGRFAGMKALAHCSICIERPCPRP